MDRIFKIHCSAIGEIMGQVGLTEKQKLRLFELATREKALTDLMQLEYDTLMFKRDNPELPETAKTFLQNWYANDQEQIHSKFIDKGNQVEIELIEWAEANHTLTTGYLKWNVRLEPNANVKKVFKYSVKYPKDKIVNL